MFYLNFGRPLRSSYAYFVLCYASVLDDREFVSHIFLCSIWPRRAGVKDYDFFCVLQPLRVLLFVPVTQIFGMNGIGMCGI